MSINEKELITNYFNSLVKEFIKDPLHKDITIVFKDYLGGSGSVKTLGNTHKSGGGSETKWQTVNGVKVPGSERTTYFPFKYEISFLNKYEDRERWRGTVAHEFAHLYLYSTIDDHDHDDNFYSHMERFENWMDKKWGLTPRQDKSGDWLQHVDSKKDENKRKKTCKGCKRQEIIYNTAGECFQCHQKGSESSEEQKEFNRLVDSLKNSQNLSTLEKTWQTIKTNPLYSSNKKSLKTFEENNKVELETHYKNCKSYFQSQDSSDNERLPKKKNNFRLDQSIDNNEKTGLLIIGGITILLIGIMFLVITRKPRKRFN